MIKVFESVASRRTFHRDLAALGRYGVVDRAELLVTLPGRVNFPGPVGGLEANS
jgi:hypothetical protein